VGHHPRWCIYSLQQQILSFTNMKHRIYFFSQNTSMDVRMSIIASITTCVLRFHNAFTSIFLCYYCIYALFLFLLLFVWENMWWTRRISYIYILAYIAPFIVLKLGPAGDPGLGAGARLSWKNKKRKNPAWPGDPVDFCFFFFTKMMLFWF
jgi:hypothetical protein